MSNRVWSRVASQKRRRMGVSSPPGGAERSELTTSFPHASHHSVDRSLSTTGLPSVLASIPNACTLWHAPCLLCARSCPSDRPELIMHPSSLTLLPPLLSRLAHTYRVDAQDLNLGTSRKPKGDMARGQGVRSSLSAGLPPSCPSASPPDD